MEIPSFRHHFSKCQAKFYKVKSLMVFFCKEAKKKKETHKLNCVNCILSFAIISEPQENFEIYREKR